MSRNLQNGLVSFPILLSFATGGIVCLVVLSSAARAQVLLDDEFDGAMLNTSTWRLPFGDEGAPGPARNVQKTDPTTQLPTIESVTDPGGDGSVARLVLDTFFSDDPGTVFHMHEMVTKRNFARGGRLSFEARMRMQNPQDPQGNDLPGGFVGSFFSFDVTRAENNALVRDEIDHEILTNDASKTWTNIANNKNFTGDTLDFMGHSPAGFDLHDFHTYRVDWIAPRPDKPNGEVRWLVDGTLIRTDSDLADVPDDPMTIRHNIWSPTADFAEGHNENLSPDSTSEDNKSYYLEIDRVKVSRHNTSIGPNLLTNPSFEDDLNGWSAFNIASVLENDMPVGNFVPTVTGTKAMKAFGPFQGSANASGVFQSVPAQAGQEFHGSVWIQTSTLHNPPNGDSILGTSNFASVDIEFLDGDGNVLTDPNGNPPPDDMTERNSNSTPVLDGRDPNLVEDLYLQGIVEARAPAGTAFARLLLPFVQLCLDENGTSGGECDPGSAFFDDAILSLITPELVGDLDCDGDVDFDDIDPFVLGLTNAAAYEDQFGVSVTLKGDTDGDGDVDFDDINGFVSILTSTAGSGTTRSVPEPSTAALGGMALLALAAGLCRRRG